jgi:hypothetical protein
MLQHLPDQLQLGAFLLWAGLAGTIVTALWPSGHDDRDPGNAILSMGLVAIIGLSLMADAHSTAINAALEGLEGVHEAQTTSTKRRTDVLIGSVPHQDGTITEENRR